MTTADYLTQIEALRPQLVEAAEANCATPDDAEDAVQDGVMYCLDRLADYDPEKAALRTWVTNIVIRRALNNNRVHYRNADLTKEPRGFPDEEDDGKARRAQAKPKPDKEPGYDPNPDLRISVRQALDQLDPADRELAAVVFMEEYTEEECADLLGVTDRTVRRRLVGVKQQLKDILKDWRA